MNKLLIVDDEPDLLDSLAEFFADEGYAVQTARHGAEALERLGEPELPALVILDLLMPGISGIELYDTMQRDPRLCKIPVIVSTSDPSRAPSGVLIMKKPVNLARLLDVVRQHMPG
jgi:two-component system, sensor histidine kinase and response regulator